MGDVLGYEYAQDYAELIRRVFFGDAPGGPVPPGIIVANEKPEWAVLRGELLWQASIQQVAVGGQFQAVGVTVASKDRVLVILYCLIATNGTFRVGLAPDVLGSLANLETREYRASKFMGKKGTYSAAADPFGSQNIDVTVGVNSSQIVPGPWICGNSTTFGQQDFLVSPSAVNTQVNALIVGYERRLRPEEQVYF